MFRFRVVRRLSSVRRKDAPTTHVDVVDDPDLPIRLIRAIGPLDAETIGLLVATWRHLTTPHAVYVDLEDAHLVDVSAMRRLESALDHLETQRIDIRVVGLDPHHPRLEV